MAISFPLNPSIGDEYSASGKTWTWNGAQWEGVPATSGIPYGTTVNRPATPELGQPYFNADESRLELYSTAIGWQNIVQETPSVVSIVGTYYESNASNTITINGTNFAVGAIAYAVGTNGVEIQADTTTLVSAVELSATFSGLVPANEPYDIKVVNPSNLYGMLYETLQIDDIPVFITQSGTLGTYIEESPMSVQISVTDDEESPLIFSITSGSLPTGLSLNTSTGEISGTPTNLALNTTSTFEVTATDGNNTATRSFSITINDRGPAWVTNQTLPSFSKNIAYSETISAIDDDASTVSYSVISGSLPTNISLNSLTGEISGTPSSELSAIFTIRATDTNSGEYSDRQFTLPNSPPEWQTTSTFSIEQGNPFSLQLSAIDDSGASLSYSVLTGSLPTGISITTSGLISGTTSASLGSYIATIRATEPVSGQVSDREFTINVVPAPLELVLEGSTPSQTGDSSSTVSAFFGSIGDIGVYATASGTHNYQGYYYMTMNSAVRMTATAEGAGGQKGNTGISFEHRGRSVTGVFDLNAGDVVVFFAGKNSPSNDQTNMGGGGASVVMLWNGSEYVPLVVGAGGSSARTTETPTTYSARPLSVTATGVSSFRQGFGDYPAGEGLGGIGRPNSNVAQTGGAGFYSNSVAMNDGGTSTYTDNGDEAIALNAGALGSGATYRGGFGGGGGDTGNNSYSAGGGGYWGAFEGRNTATTAYPYYTLLGSGDDDRAGALSYVNSSSITTTDNGASSNTYGKVSIRLEFV